MRLVKSPAGRDIEEIWTWESVDTGDSALLNLGKLNQLCEFLNTIHQERGTTELTLQLIGTTVPET